MLCSEWWNEADVDADVVKSHKQESTNGWKERIEANPGPTPVRAANIASTRPKQPMLNRTRHSDTARGEG
jgi:hypothetical protein